MCDYEDDHNILLAVFLLFLVVV